MGDIPSHILEAVNGLLAPYGERFSPGEPSAPSGKGYMNWKQACEYTGLSVSTLQRASRAGEFPVHKLHPGKTGAVLIAVSDLDSYIRRH